PSPNPSIAGNSSNVPDDISPLPPPELSPANPKKEKAESTYSDDEDEDGDLLQEVDKVKFLTILQSINLSRQLTYSLQFLDEYGPNDSSLMDGPDIAGMYHKLHPSTSSECTNFNQNFRIDLDLNDLDDVNIVG